MRQRNPLPTATRPSRRDFLKASTASVAGVAMAGNLSIARGAQVVGSDLIKIALIGAGGRGRGAAVNALSNASHKNVKLVAIADAFQKAIDVSLKAIQGRCGDKVDVPPARQFTGLDAYQKAIDCGVDMVLLCTPPGFRPVQFEAAVEAGKIIFMEKPVAVDVPGYRRILAANKEAEKKRLHVGVGHHLRHETKYLDVVKRIRGGAIGPVKFMRAYFNSAGVWTRPRQQLAEQLGREPTEMEYQVNNWYYFNWLSGDHIVEQHVHDLDVMNWIAGAHPTEANGMGGRQFRISKDHGDIFDHHAVEFSYANGIKMFSQSRHIPNCWNSFSEHAHGTKGYVSIRGAGKAKLFVDGQEPQQLERGGDGHQIEQDDLFAAVLAGKAFNEVDYGADATMTAILGRMATYSGKVVTWDEAVESELDISPSGNTWDATPQPQPGLDGIYPCAMPGITKV